MIVVPTAILTRNSLSAVEEFVRRTESKFDKLLTRDFELGYKPSPKPIQHLCEEWKLSSKEVVMVGDSKDDIEAGQAADAWTVLLENDHNQDLKTIANFSVKELSQLPPLLGLTS